HSAASPRARPQGLASGRRSCGTGESVRLPCQGGAQTAAGGTGARPDRVGRRRFSVGVSVYYTAYGSRGLATHGQAAVQRIAVAASRRQGDTLTERLPHWHCSGEAPPSLTDVSELYDGLHLYGPAHLSPGELLSGASKVTHLDCGLD